MAIPAAMVGAGGAAVAAPVIAATAATLAASAAAAYVFGMGCEKGINMYTQHDCKNTGYTIPKK
jgi:hypothetical protein